MGNPSSGKTPEKTIDQYLFEGTLQGVVVACSETERPLQGLAGLIDWRFRGIVSQCIQAGMISGKPGECAYIPVTQNQRTYHLLLVGNGPSAKAGARAGLPAESLKALKKNLVGLKLSQIGVSKSDFGNVKDEFFEKNLKGIPVSIMP